MKALPFNIPKPLHDALIYQEDFETVFYDKLHQHEEIQISFIANGEGTLIVGDSVNYYKTNDVLIIGSHIPHVFKSDTTSKDKSLMISLFFTKSSFGDAFFDLEELSEIKPFFSRIENGIKINSEGNSLMDLFLKLGLSSKLERFILFLKIIKVTSSSNYVTLSSFINEKKYSDIEGKRMRDVMAFTINNYTNNISLDDVSEKANMTKNAFCKYFKKRTNKTYIGFLNELRVENACKLIRRDNDFSIAEIANKCGFNNISNFNRQFKDVKNITPSEYKKLNHV